MKWDEVTLESAVVFSPKVKLQKGKPCAFIGMEDLDPNSNFVYSPKAVDFEGQGGAKFGEGHILFARITPCLQNRKIAQAKLGEYQHGFGSTEFLVFDEKPGTSDINFLLYLLKTKYVVGHAENSMVGASGRQRADWQYFKTIKIPLPPLPLQRQIAAVLGRYDALLENYQAQVAALEGLAQELYREWFVRGRCPGAPAGPNGELPAGWRAGTLREIVAFYIGGGWGQEEPDSDHTISGHVVRGTDIPNLKRGQANLDVYRYHKASNMTSRELQAGDIVFEVSGGSKDQGLGRNVLITEDVLAKFGDKVMPASFCKLIRANQKLTSYYFLQQLLDKLLESQEMAQFEVQSTGISNFQFEDFLDYLPVVLPAKEALNRFDDLVAPMYKKINILSSQAANLRATRDALLPRLLSGQLLPALIPTPI